MTNPTPDPRPGYRAALEWTGAIAAGVRPEQLDAPTPCTEFDVRTLLQHLVNTARRSVAIAAGGAPMDVPLLAGDVADRDLAGAYAREAERAVGAWADDATLDTEVTVPWGRATGRQAMGAYTNETLVHGWDLAVATGQPSETDPALAEAALVAARSYLPAERRGGHVPFAPPVEPAPDAGPTERLANWSGRARTATR